jgi:hypothetical protein
MTHDTAGGDEADFPPLDLGDDETPCVYCGETACERSCTGALLADAPGEDARGETHAPDGAADDAAGH